ncbi:MAG: PHP domain-containing protein [Arenicellales bacterium]
MIDLHTHSTVSDGSYTPTELVVHSSINGIRHLALTDHDTVDGLDEANIASKEHGISLIPGIELSAQWQNRTLHIVGLSIDPTDPSFQTTISEAKRTRADRARLIGARLEKAGVKYAYRLTRELAGTDLLGRLHFAKMLVEQGYAKDFKQVFKRYMVRGKPGYASAEWIDTEAAIKVIHQAGGVAVMAHPARYSLSMGQLRKALRDFKYFGGDAMEVVSGNSHPQEIASMSRLADDYSLSASVGSDFHGPEKPWVKLGRLQTLPINISTVWTVHDLW